MTILCIQKAVMMLKAEGSGNYATLCIIWQKILKVQLHLFSSAFKTMQECDQKKLV